jgi:hypothetical protein
VPVNRSLLAAFAALLGAIPATAANLDWSYEVTVSPTSLNSSSDPSVGLLGLAGTGNGTAQVGALQVSVFGIGSPSEGTFDPTLQLFSVDFTLKDITSDASQVLTFQGGVGGVINQLGANLEFGFSEPSTQTVTLGGNTYDVALLPLTLSQDASAGGPQSEDLGTILAQVTLVGSDPTPNPDPTPDPDPSPDPDPPSLETPEPASLTLAGLGVAALGAWASRGRSRRHSVAR